VKTAPPPQRVVVKEKTVILKEKTVVVIVKEKSDAAKRSCIWIDGYKRADGTEVKGYRRCPKT